MKTNGIVVLNLHGVLIDEQWEILKRMQSRWSQYSSAFEFPGFLSHDEFIQRPQYDVCNSYLKKDQKTKAHYIYNIYTTQKRIIKSILEADDFYSYSTLLAFAKKCILKSSFLESKKIGKIIILIDEFSKKQAENALRFCQEVFKHPKFNFLVVKPEEKWKFVSHNLRIFSLYIDHSITNIRHITESIPDLSTAEFLIPRYKFNKMPTEVSMLIHGKNGAFTYYSEESSAELETVEKNIL